MKLLLILTSLFLVMSCGQTDGSKPLERKVVQSQELSPADEYGNLSLTELEKIVKDVEKELEDIKIDACVSGTASCLKNSEQESTVRKKLRELLEVVVSKALAGADFHYYRKKARDNKIEIDRLRKVQDQIKNRIAESKNSHKKFLQELINSVEKSRICSLLSKRCVFQKSNNLDYFISADKLLKDLNFLIKEGENPRYSATTLGEMIGTKDQTLKELLKIKRQIISFFESYPRKLYDLNLFEIREKLNNSFLSIEYIGNPRYSFQDQTVREAYNIEVVEKFTRNALSQKAIGLVTINSFGVINRILLKDSDDISLSEEGDLVVNRNEDFLELVSYYESLKVFNGISLAGLEFEFIDTIDATSELAIKRAVVNDVVQNEEKILSLVSEYNKEIGTSYPLNKINLVFNNERHGSGFSDKGSTFNFFIDDRSEVKTLSQALAEVTELVITNRDAQETVDRISNGFRIFDSFYIEVKVNSFDMNYYDKKKKFLEDIMNYEELIIDMVKQRTLRNFQRDLNHIVFSMDPEIKSGVYTEVFTTNNHLYKIIVNINPNEQLGLSHIL